MYQCEYCGRYLKENYNNCPGCGAHDFKKVNKSGVVKVTTVPDGGYKINLNNFKRDNFWGIILIIFGGFFVFALFSFILLWFAFDEFFSSAGEVISFLNNLPFLALLFDIPFLCAGLLLIFSGIKLLKKNKEKILKIKKLCNNGVLIKNLPYEVEPTGSIINGQPVYCIKVNYEHENGTVVPLTSEGKYDGHLSREDGTVDLLIDPNDFSNYFIDFEIF